jgi:D-alanyl-lipoteichoic acid acyltransferase DltB (MBOAT superfamily)
VYCGRARAERNFITYALFVTFFPQLVAGPIERTGNLLPQFKVNHDFDYDRVTSGLRLAAWGMFKKVVIADRLAIYVNGVYGNPQVYPAATLTLATFFFAFQIYCDFSAYSNIAVGCARVLGFNLMTNFRQPYFSRSVTDFWRRWHISLSTWLRDYLYIPLGGSRKGAARQKINVLITFLISGLWHGAGWHFAVWGALHGLFQVIGRGTASLRSAAGNRIGLRDDSLLRKLFQICFTFILVCAAWIFFRADSLSTALLICKKMAALPGEIITCLIQLPQTGITHAIRKTFSLGHMSSGYLYSINGFYLKAAFFSIMLIGLVVLVDLLSRKQPCQALVKRCPLVVRWAGYYLLILAIMQSWPQGNQTAIEFIYFAF